MKRVASITLTVVMLISVVLLCSSCFSIYRYDNGDRYKAGGASIGELVTRIDIGWVAGEVRIEAYDGDVITFREETTNELEEKRQLHYFLDGTTLYLQYAKSGITNTTAGFGEKKLIVMIPKDNVYDLDVETVSSDIYIDAQNDFNEVDIETVSGYSRININHSNTMDFETVSGNVSLSLYSCAAPCKIDSVSGNVELFVRKENGFVLECETVSGVFESEVAVQQTMGQYIYKGTDANGIINHFEIETVSGNVDVFPLSTHDHN